MNMIKITFPDGSLREYEMGVTGLQIAESISSRLAQDVLACGVNGEVVELNRPINEDAAIVLYKWEDAEGKHAFWHTSAHLMAEAMQELYPGIQFGIGPAIENGFYYDVMPPVGTVIREADFINIEKKMLELAQRKEAVVRADFERIAAVKREFEECFDSSFNILSMGMSDDYPIAIEYGSTMVRVGSYIFGAREY